MFAYCGNNSVAGIDPSGCRPVITVNIEDGAGSLYNEEKYNREAAIDYAREWSYSYNPAFYRYWTDCANFVSQCLYVGGIEQTDSWHMYKYMKSHSHNPLAWLSQNYRYNWDVGAAWSVASAQYEYFKSIDGNISVYIGSVSELASLISTYGIQAGDLMYFLEDGSIHHATIISSVDKDSIYYSGHTLSRFGESLSSHFPAEGVYVIVIGN